MAYVSLYRKYRPNSFAKLFGQDHIVRTLVNQIKNDLVGHAYLFTGTRGTGKTSCAKIFARAVNCLSPIDGSPCGECEVCRALATPGNMDILEIDAASNNGIDEIRDLRDKIKYPPVHSRYKVYIIDEVHMLSTSAFNALLKTLEEPPRHAIFILATTEVHKLPQTILSRCMRFDFRLVPTERIAEHIAGIFKENSKDFEPEAVRAIAEAGEGSVRDALSVADMCLSYSDEKLTLDDVLFVLGASDKRILVRLAGHVLSGECDKVLALVEEIVRSGRSISVLARDMAGVFRNVMTLKLAPTKDVGLPPDVLPMARKIAELVETERLLRAMEIFCELEGSMRYSVQPRVLFEAAAIKAASIGSSLNIDGLLLRINELERKIESLTDGSTVAVAQSVIAPRTDSAPILTQTQPESQPTQSTPMSATTMWGQLIRKLRTQSMFALMSSASDIREVKLEGDTVIIKPENVADIRLLTLDANIRTVEKLLTEISGRPIKLNVIKPEVTDGNELETIKRLAEPDAVKIL